MEEKHLIPNSTQIPNVLLDFVIPRISEAEGKCLLYICRRTYGFHKERDRISLTQFVEGLKDKDYGSGLSRPAVVEALRNLIGAGLVKTIPTSKGNYYEINLDLAVDNQVVKKVNQLRRLTKSGKESKPKQVKLLNLQKKGNKGNKDDTADFKKLKRYNDLKSGFTRKTTMVDNKGRAKIQEEVASEIRSSGLRK